MWRRWACSGGLCELPLPLQAGGYLPYRMPHRMPGLLQPLVCCLAARKLSVHPPVSQFPHTSLQLRQVAGIDSSWGRLLCVINIITAAVGAAAAAAEQQ